MEGEDAEALSDEHEDMEDRLEESRERDRRLLNVLHEQNETQAVHTEILRSIDDKVSYESKAKNRIIYALLALIAGILYASDSFVPVSLPIFGGPFI